MVINLIEVADPGAFISWAARCPPALYGVVGSPNASPTGPHARGSGQDRRSWRSRNTFEIAIRLERDPSVRRFLKHRQSALAP